MKNLYLMLVFLATSHFFYSQTQEIEIDTISINIVSPTSLATGYRSILIPSDSTSQVFIEHILQKEIGVSMRNYGLGNLSSISVKGLSPSQNLFLWEGIPINSSLNGQVDGSIISSKNHNRLSYRSGGSSTFGSGAMGGTFNLEYIPIFNNKTSILTENMIGSFGLIRHLFSITKNTNKNSLHTGINYLHSQNEFPFRDRFGNNLRTENSGFDVVDFYLNTSHKINHKNRISLNIWSQWASRNVGATEAKPTSTQKQYDYNNRANASWLYQNNRFQQQIQMAYTREYYEYFADYTIQGKGSASSTDNYFANYFADYQFKKSNLKIGINSKYTNGNGENIGTPSIKELHSFINYQFRLGNKLKNNLSLRKSFSSLFNIPWTYDIGVDFMISSNLFFKASHSATYRTPTFNDLFWKTGGNPNLKPEQGQMTETVIEYTSQQKKHFISLSAHYGEVRDWILWYPNSSGIWTPSNLDFVVTKGGNLKTKHTLLWKSFLFKISNLFSYTETYNQRTQNSLIYIPKWSYNNGVDIFYKKWSLGIEHFFTGKRPTSTDNQYFLKEFHLWNASLSREFNLAKIKNKMSFGINNFTNTSYNTMQGYPMPMRNYYINLKINF